jgi:hypothetical protein
MSIHSKGVYVTKLTNFVNIAVSTYTTSRDQGLRAEDTWH